MACYCFCDCVIRLMWLSVVPVGVSVIVPVAFLLFNVCLVSDWLCVFFLWFGNVCVVLCVHVCVSCCL